MLEFLELIYMDLVEDEKNRDFLFFLMLMFYLTNYLKKKHEIVYIYRGSLGCPDRGLCFR